MATIKSFTDLSQSKKLAEILPIESADMYHFIDNIDKVYNVGFGYRKVTADYYSKTKLEYIPCWSLAALLEVLKNKIVYGGNDSKSWFISYTKKNPTKTIFIYREHLVDACYKAILELNELNLL